MLSWPWPLGPMVGVGCLQTQRGEGFAQVTQQLGSTAGTGAGLQGVFVPDDLCLLPLGSNFPSSSLRSLPAGLSLVLGHLQCSLNMGRGQGLTEDPGGIQVKWTLRIRQPWQRSPRRGR